MPNSQQNLIRQRDALLAVNKLAMPGADFASVMEAVVQGTLFVLPNADGAIVELQEGHEMVYAAASGSMAKHIGMRINVEGSLTGLSIREERLLYCADSETDSRVDRESCRKVGLRAMIIAPYSIADGASASSRFYPQIRALFRKATKSSRISS